MSTPELDGGTDATVVHVDADVDAALPVESTVTLVSPNGIELNGAGQLVQGYVITGSRATADSNARDGIIVQTSGSETTATFIGGELNDQLYAVASKGDQFMAVGLTRSFRNGANQDQSLVVWSTPSGLAAARYFIASDQAVQLRAVEPHNTGWVAAGRYLNGQGIIVALMNKDATPRMAITLDVGLKSHQVRAVHSDGENVYLIGYGDSSGESVGYVVALNGQTLTIEWSRLFSATSSLELHGVASKEGNVFVAGRQNNDGLLLSLNASSGDVVEQQLLQERPLMGASRDGDSLWLAGATGSSTWVGFVSGEMFRGVSFDELGAPVPSPIPLVKSTLIGSRQSGFVIIPLNESPIAACSGGPLGNRITAVVEPANVTVDATAVVGTAITLSFEALTTITMTTATVSGQSACP